MVERRGMASSTRWAALGTGACLGLLARSASAEGGGFGTAGYLHSFQSGADGNGVEATYAYHPSMSGDKIFNVGGFLQAEHFGAPDRERFAIGFQAAFIVGLELGYAYRTAGDLDTGSIPATHDLHFAPFLALGMASFAYRFSVPLAPSGGYDLEHAFVLALKIPFSLHGKYDVDDFTNLSFGHGRPLREEAAKTSSSAGSLGIPFFRPCADGHRSAMLAAAWANAAREEWDSVLAFARLWRDLRTAGAPESLLRAVRRASGHERRHARSCLAIARSFDAKLATEPAPLPEFRRLARSRRKPSAGACARPLAELAVESLLDGCLAEGAAAVYAKRAAHAARSPRIKAVLWRISVEEAEHAELAWRIVEWCLESDARRIWDEDAVWRALWGRVSRIAASVPRWSTATLPSGEGFLGAVEELEIAAETWASTRLRLLALLTSAAGGFRGEASS